MTPSLTYDRLNQLDVWHDMPTITLDEMRSVKLMNRIDTKYVLAEDEVLTLLEHMAECGYRVQVINGVRLPIEKVYHAKDVPDGGVVRIYLNNEFWGMAERQGDMLVWKCQLPPNAQ